jgi:membrane fusion protein (multidrug efflux system)
MQPQTRIKAGYRRVTGFSRFIRTLDADRFRPSALGLILAFALLAGWSVWLLRASVPLYEITDRARLEVDRAIHPIEALVAGRVVAVHLAVGMEVRAGDVLVELDTDAERHQLDEERSKLAALGPQLAALRDEVAAEEQALRQSRDAAKVSLEEARAQFREADAAARFAAVDAERQARLYADKLLAEVDLLRARTDAERRRATADSLELAVRRQHEDQRTKEFDRQVGIERLKHDQRQLEGQQSTSRAAIERLQNEIERRSIRAPVGGPLGEVATLRVGAVLRPGDRVGAVLPAGKLRAVAEFAPASALGRIRAGQNARLRLEGFPWSEYGSVPATVETVAGEIRDGRIRVELAIDPSRAPRIPLQHGLPGSVEVEVERVSPAHLVLRAAGKLLASPAGPAPGPEANP